MNEESFWVIPDIANLRTPVAILKEQATFLAEQTSGLLKGEVATSQDGNNIWIHFYIIVSALNNYRYLLLQYSQPVTFYPGTLLWFGKSQSIKIDDEESFTANLRKILSSEESQKIIQGLLVQARQTAE